MAHRLHELRGVGRFSIPVANLPPGWTQDHRSQKYTVWHDDKDNSYKSNHGNAQSRTRARE